MIKLASKNSCTGCSACERVCSREAISMRPDQFGFLYPEINTQKCIECKLCESICPVVNIEKDDPDLQNLTYAAYAFDENIREQSSSGGLFSILAKETLIEGGVVFGAMFDENFVVRHVEVTNDEGLAKLRGSKYSQSDLGNSYTNVLERIRECKRVLFAGTPCQIGGLKAFLSGKTTPADRVEEKLLTIDVICHSIPSPLAFKKYIEYLELKNGGKTASINFRSKKQGWSDYAYSVSYDYKNGNKYMSHNRDDLYMKLFLGDYICRESCAECVFRRYKRLSDITIADFWGVWNIAPEMDDDKGTSIAIIHSKKGETAFEKIKEKIRVKEISFEDGIRNNQAYIKSTPVNPLREKILKVVADGDFDMAEKLTISKRPTILQKFKRKIGILQSK